MLLGITGTDGAGKGTVVDYLVKEKGFVHASARALFLEEIQKRGLPEDRNHMRIVANDLRKKNGNDYIVRYYLNKYKEDKNTNIAIDSIRALAESQTLRENDGVLIAVDADQKLRYERVQERRSGSDKVTFEKFVEQEALEMNDPDPHGMQKAKVLEIADYIILNDGTIKELHMQIEAVLKKIDSGLN